MGTLTRSNGGSYFTTLASTANIDPDVGAAIDAELNAIVSTVNALDNANIASSPKIAGSKVDLTSSGFLPTTGGDMSAAINFLFDGVFRTMRTAGNGRIREYRGSDGAVWGISYNTYWTGAAWNGRDITDICAVLKMESDGLHYYHAVSDSAGSVPSFTEVFHMNTSGRMEVGTPRDNSLTEAMVDWANAGGLQQGVLLYEELTGIGGFGEVLADNLQVYIPSNANSLAYSARLKAQTAGGQVRFRLACGATDGTELNTNSTSYTWISEGTLDVSALSGWQSIDIDLGNTAAESSWVDRIVYRII